MQKPFWAFHTFTVVSQLALITVNRKNHEHFHSGQGEQKKSTYSFYRRNTTRYRLPSHCGVPCLISNCLVYWFVLNSTLGSPHPVLQNNQIWLHIISKYSLTVNRIFEQQIQWYRTANEIAVENVWLLTSRIQSAAILIQLKCIHTVPMAPFLWVSNNKRHLHLLLGVWIIFRRHHLVSQCVAVWWILLNTL